MTNSPNIVTGWAAFAILARKPVTPAVRRHGNWRHGGRSANGRQGMRELRLAIRVLDGRPGAVWPFEPRPLGWRRWPCR